MISSSGGKAMSGSFPVGSASHAATIETGAHLRNQQHHSVHADHAANEAVSAALMLQMLVQFSSVFILKFHNIQNSND